MGLRAIAYSVLMCALILCGVVKSASAQTSPASASPVQSSGLTLLIAKIIVDQQNVSIQFIIKNDTKSRVYLQDAEFDQSQTAFLGSGAQPQLQNVVGLQYCGESINNCSTMENAQNLSTYSYIDPGEQLSFMFVYRGQNPISTNDTISFSVALLAKFSMPNGDPTQAGSIQGVRFNFPFTPLN